MSFSPNDPFAAYTMAELEAMMQVRHQNEETLQAAERAREAEVAQLQRRLLELQSTPVSTPPLSAMSSSGSLRGSHLFLSRFVFHL